MMKKYRCNTNGQTRTRREKDEQLVRAYRESGLTQEAFARRRQMSVWTLRNACRRVNTRSKEPEEQPAGFIEVEPDFTRRAQAAASGRSYRIELDGQTALTVPAGFERQEVQSLIELLRR